MVEIIQYMYERENNWNREVDEGTNYVTSHPKVGFQWVYYGVNGPAYRTKGKVLSVDYDSGVVVTDADEIFIRG